MAGRQASRDYTTVHFLGQHAADDSIQGTFGSPDLSQAFHFRRTMTWIQMLTRMGAVQDDTTYFGAADQQAMINFRVDDLEALLASLTAAGVQIVPDGTRVELWQPIRR